MLKNYFWLHSGLPPKVFSSLRGSHGEHTCIEYGFVRTRLGNCLAAFSVRGLCWFEPNPADDAEQSFKGRWMPATLVRADDRVRAQLEEMLAGDSLALDLCGTDFQLRVWAALLDTAAGETVTYGELARPDRHAPCRPCSRQRGWLKRACLLRGLSSCVASGRRCRKL